jgi:glycosyltransferase involved in cell wall biosynthesis
MSRPPSLLILSHDVVGSQMAGPGIRYYQLARVLARTLSVTLAVPSQPHSDTDLSAPALSKLDLPGVTLATYQPDDWQTLVPLLSQATVCLVPGDLVARFPGFAQAESALVIDGYDPVLSEWLAVHAHLPLNDLHGLWRERLRQHRVQFHLGDFFICASERQRDWWLGQLEAYGRINPATHRSDPTLRQLIDVVPYGLPVEPPIATRPLIKGVWDGIATTDKVILWGGGLWPWLDPLTAIRAIHRLASTRPEIKLIFPGTRHPNPEMATMPTLLGEAKQLAQAFELTDRQVFFGDWVAYADWPNVLLESDVALTLHLDSIETRLAFRSRVLEYIWAGLPVVASTGDATSDLIAQYALGQQVPPGDDAAVAEAIAALADEAPSTRGAAFAQARAELNWERAAAPLAAFCRAPHRAPDRNEWLPDTDQTPRLQAEVTRLQAEIAQGKRTIRGYEQGRFMRAMRKLDSFKRRVWVRP